MGHFFGMFSDVGHLFGTFSDVGLKKKRVPSSAIVAKRHKYEFLTTPGMCLIPTEPRVS